MKLVAATAVYTPVITSRIIIGSGSFVIEGDLVQEETATADSGDATTLTDTGAFAGDVYAGMLVHIISGTGSGQYRVIKSHTDDALTPVGRFDTSPANDSVYEILSWGSLISGAASWYLGDVTLLNLGSTSVASAFIRPIGLTSTSITRCSFISSGSTSAALYVGNSSATAILTCCVLNGNAQATRAISIVAPCSAVQILQTYIHGYTGSNPGVYVSGANGSVLIIRVGSYIDGADGSGAVILIDDGLNLGLYTPTVNGAVDKSTIEGDAGNTYGIYAQGSAWSGFAVATYITFVGAFSVGDSGANAAQFSYVS